jgi:hypothetical protein
VNVFAATGMLFLVRGAREKIGEKAMGLVALPADTFAAPGATDRRCENGHVFSSKWASCPHCPAK